MLSPPPFVVMEEPGVCGARFLSEDGPGPERPCGRPALRHYTLHGGGASTGFLYARCESHMRHGGGSVELTESEAYVMWVMRS